MRIVGTAGHVDHGKSSLVQALTGTHPDRLKEEQERQMTIELGFASMRYPDGLEVGFIDVPGHIDFIENMLMGVGAIDAAMLVVAADEGVMPQTREHLDILRLLDVQHVFVALTKTDLVDEEWLGLVQEDLKEYLAANDMGAPIVPVSARTGAGMEELQSLMRSILLDAPERKDFGRPRLFVDRVFSLSGFGTIVTGTLIDGTLHRGARVEILPVGISARVRGLQSFGEDLENAGPGNRVAVNLSGVSVEDIQRGMTLVLPESYQTTDSICVRLLCVPGAHIDIVHDMQAKLFHGAAQVQARIRLLGSEAIQAGGQGYLQLELSEPITPRFGDRFILRRPSPSETIGGGDILDPHPVQRLRRFEDSVQMSLFELEEKTLEKYLEHTIRQRGPLSISRLSILAGLNVSLLQETLAELVTSGSVIIIGQNETITSASRESMVMHTALLEELSVRLAGVLEEYHGKNPYVFGVPVEVLRSRLELEQEVFQFLLKKLQESGEVEVKAGKARQNGFEVELTERDEEKAREAMTLINREPLNTPSPDQIRQLYGSGIYDYLIDQGLIIQVSDDVIFSGKQYQVMLDDLRKALEQREKMKVTEVREILPTSRKYLLAFLEHLDRIGVTRRDGDFRFLK